MASITAPQNIFSSQNSKIAAAKMAPRKRSSPSPISIGNCKVEIDGGDYACESIAKGLLISVPNGAKIKISMDDSKKQLSDNLLDNVIGGKCFPWDGYSFMLINPNDEDGYTKSVLQEVLNIYMEQLPDMNYAANTGKESHFLEKCISSGKYKTLILKSNCTIGIGKVIAAVSFQIIHTDMQFAEIPLAAVSLNYQKKGIGHLIYKELKERLQHVGISTILCWADKVSEGFWFKQGFISIGEVDTKGKARRLPIKADVRRALCFPGGSTLLIAHLKKYNVASANSSEHDKLCFSVKSSAKSRSYIPPGDVEGRGNDTSVFVRKHEAHPAFYQTESTQAPHFLKDGCSMDSHDVNVVSPSTIRFPCPETKGTCSRVGVHPEVTENVCDTNGKSSSSSQIVKKRVWKASVSSLKSKRIRGAHCIDDCQDNQDLDADCIHETDTTGKNCSLETSGCKPPSEIIPSDPTNHSHSGYHAEGRLSCYVDLVPKGNYPKVMFMNIADDSKKACLTKIVEDLGGSVTCNGSSSTHVITGKARRTLNFCVALCSGAWIVSPHWLKESFREGKFVGETPFILEDEDYLLKYKFELKDAVIRAKSNPHSLFRGYTVCVGKHIQPSMDVLSAIIKAAGGNISRRLDGIKDPSKTIFLACEENMEDAMIAAKKGVGTFSSDWFMSCVMKQDLDMDAPQFAESL